MTRRILIFISALALLGIAWTWWFASMVVAPKNKDVRDFPADMPGEIISLRSDSGAFLSGWHFVAEGDQGVVVLLHGIRMTRMIMEKRARFLHKLGFSTALIDFRAHGESTGDETTIGYLEKFDVQAALRFARLRHPGEPLGVIGQSMGGAAALLANDPAIDALVLESVYPDIERAVHNRVGRMLGPLGPVSAELLLVQMQPRFGIAPADLRPIDFIDKIGPVMFISGVQDSYTPPNETEQLFELARGPKELWLIEGARHQDMYKAAPDEYEQRVGSFFLQHMRAQPVL